MKKKYLLLPIILLSCFQIFSQQKKVEDEYYDYFKLPREGLHLHLNKTTYFQGEEIWFKGYAYDQKNQRTSKATANINVGIYDAEGNQVKKALFSSENGLSYGNFPVDSTFTAGTYYIKAKTNWMNNFKENDAFIQKIKIITDQETAETKVTEDVKFDFQFLPEGGHIVANTTNNIGFKVVNNNGKGVIAYGALYDQDQNKVASFEANALGMGKFLLLAEKDAIYTAEIFMEDGSILKKELPKAKAQGVSLIARDTTEDKIILEFNTNEETLANHGDKSYKILIQQSGKLKTAFLKFTDTQKAVSIEKERLFKGVNIITVFDNDQNPILERLLFNDYGIKKPNLKVEKLNTLKDSVILSVKALNLNTKGNISISVLPERTESYDPKHNILSSFYLKPHIKGLIENPQYYFHNMDKKKKYELDVLLLTQGWSRYEWKDIFENKPIAKYSFENGISVAGRVNLPATGVKQIFIHATKNHDSKFIDLDKDQRFELTGLFLEEDETLKFSYVSENGPLRKPRMYVRFTTPSKKDKIPEIYLEGETKNIKSNTANFRVPDDFFYEDAEALDAVLLKAEKERPKYNTAFLLNPSAKEITMEEYNRYLDIVEYLNFNGFNASQSMGQVFINSRIAGGRPPSVFFNDVRLNGFDILFRMSLAEIERVVIDRYSVAPSPQQATLGVIKIYSRKTPLFEKPELESPYLKATAPLSFAVRKKYYSPKYASYLNPVFEKFGAISWFPMIELNTETASTFKIYDTYTKNVTLFIEGISEDGDLISERKTIQIR
ncbi:MAG: hypothetical protein AAF611_04300 [Bacteroidota bacterium]